MDKTEDHDILKNKITEGQQIMDNLSVDKHVTEEEFQNFMHRVTEVEKIVKKLASSNPEEQEHGQILADEILDGRSENIICDDTELKIKMNRTVINKCSINKSSTNEEMSKEAFMKSVEKDAKERAENRKIRNERAETLKTIGNGAFKEKNYEKAVTYYSKALEQRKDSTVLWNNRALSYIQLGLFEKALSDCEWALKVNNTNLKALLNSAKCYKQLGDETKYKEYILLAKERNPHLTNFINGTLLMFFYIENISITILNFYLIYCYRI
ncbi:tetratricopeptide repeat protein 12-like isoform X1 [Apis cerana]|uniref:tetratricopeptide repeat protein 12-like isoform X1 n=1 Tax=Apis cerana TaxID=7461 RepID=UPI0007E2C302|nr:tetratricopeptide repeat protein 12-like isoform X1 [Apis cerana]